MGFIGGVDDAGRGSILGPIVIGGVSVEERHLNKLIDLGVRDSKLLSKLTRERLYHQIRNICHKFVIIEIFPNEIDHFVLLGKKLKRLNYLEAITMAKVIDNLEAKIVYVDSSDINCIRFRDDILSKLQKKIDVISSHKADILYPIVSAASIIAKVKRDSIIKELSIEYGNIGSGYPSDPITLNFLTSWINKNKSYPKFSRKSWKTFKRLMNRKLEI
jgi:ribonuclease HII